MDLNEESSLNHKSKKFCNDVSCDDKSGVVNCENYSVERSLGQEGGLSDETRLDQMEATENDHCLDVTMQYLKSTDEPDKCSSDAETGRLNSIYVGKKDDVLTEPVSSDPTVAVTSEESSAGNGVPEPSDASTIDVNDKIDYGQASLYWKAVPATVNGMLGGFAHISSTDINGSSALIKWIFNQKEKPGHGRCVDCGAGIGRITQRLLQKHFGKVDLVEQSPEFVEKAKEIFASNSKIGEIYCMGLQDFTPSPGIYDVVWTQWVLGYLRDDDLITFFRRMSESLKPNGVLVVKENFTTECDGIPAHTVLDSEDSSVTRPLAILLKLASAAGLNLLRMVQQRRFPKQLYKVYMLVFKPERYSIKALPE